MRHTILSSFIVVSLLPLTGQADTAASESSSAEVERLIAQWGSRSFELRDAATEALKAKGKAILPALRKALTHRSAEVRRRASGLIPLLETEALLNPTYVTIKAKDKTVRQILDQLTRQTGYDFEYYDNSQITKMSIDIDRQPFWKAIEEISQKAGIMLQHGYSDTKVRLRKTEGYAPFVSHSGMFRFAPSSFSQYRSINLQTRGIPNAEQRSQSLSLSLYVYSEPKRPILGYGQVKLNAAYDSLGNSMLRPASSGNSGRYVSRYGSGYHSISTQVSANLTRPSMKAERARLIRGTVPLVLLVEEKKLTVAEKLPTIKDKTVKLGKTEFRIDYCKLNKTKQYELRMSVTNRDPEGANDYSWLNSLYRRLEILDEHDQVITNRSNNWNNSSANSVSMTIKFYQNGNKPVKPTKLLFKEWKTVLQDVKFELKDLPLP